MKVLVLGASGLLGSKIFSHLLRLNGIEVVGSTRGTNSTSNLCDEFKKNLLTSGDLTNLSELMELINSTQPDAVINCIAAGKHNWADPERMFAVFSLLPQRLSWLCEKRGARFVQISSDGVFSGLRGGYTEDDIPDATDVYGVAKQLGEIHRPGAVTLRTSVVGPSLTGESGLLDWFLKQEGTCRGFRKAIFTGLPSVEIAQLVGRLLLEWSQLEGIYHLASQPISKFDLLVLIANRHAKKIDIIPDASLVLDRSLNAEKFRLATDYIPKNWSDLVDKLV